MNDKVHLFFITLADGQIAYDIRITDPTATIADYLAAQTTFAKQYLADCKGCDGCCYERAPLTIMDIPNLSRLVSGTDYPAHRAVSTFGTVKALTDGAVDIMLRRTEEQACCLLEQTQKCCTQHQARPFVCRSHFCIGKSDLANELRSYITNYGLDALILQLYAEEQSGAPPLLPAIEIKDYQGTPLADKNDYAQVLLKDCLPAVLWQQIYEK